MLRTDLEIVASWIESGSRVLDLGCGCGELLLALHKHKGVRGTGIEIKEERASSGIVEGVNIIQGDINEELSDYPDWESGHGFDYIILSQTLMHIYDPLTLIREMLRVGRRAIVSFPNFSHWHNRMQLFLTGRAPVSSALPYAWYNTPNIRVISLLDFKAFCREYGFPLLREAAIYAYQEQGDVSSRIVRFMPNLRARYGIFMLGRK